MAEATLDEIMLGIAERLDTLPELNTVDYVPDDITPPIAVVGVPPIPNYHMTMKRGTYDIRPTVTVLVGSALDSDGQYLLAQFASPVGERSIPKAIMGDRTLAGRVDDCVVDSFQPLGIEEVGVLNYYGGVFTLRVLARGDGV
ncbi:hypothetical protein Aph01nite_59260 [Acrocarpospora phusangensis]|uniref:Uncharacterized protein n=1 Tax=Acrocarpospora phusangensis TaxID=1070424 RepID=A0A919UMR1_9ACTN|nr:hypothetical protein [Acrocarpospora phusangensis]GIH27616.1 hypothetical protein Aph01nite_59260 [Acrocarpospora phusangensis]